MSEAEDALKQAKDAINKVFAPLIETTQSKIHQLESAGIDPSKYFDLDSNETVDFYQMLIEYTSARDQAVNKIENQITLAVKNQKKKEAARSAKRVQDQISKMMKNLKF